MNAVVVCPEGKERLSLLSGRSRFTMRFNDCVMIPPVTLESP